ncbi:MAG: tetratricopeptide repeat protein, partial [Planctomycetota bacterium]
AEADASFQEVLDTQRRVLEPEHADTLKTLKLMAQHYRAWGDSARQEGDNDAAIAAYRRAIELKDDGGGPHNNVALALRATGDYDGALAAVQKAVENWRRVADANSGNELARKNLQAALKTQATTAGNWAWKLATAENASERDPQKATELARQATELKPERANHWNNLGVALYRAGDWQAAIEG